MISLIPYGSRSMDNFFDAFERSLFPDEPRHTAFRTDIRDEGDHYLVEAELPGFRKEDIDLDLKDGVLTISAKREEKTEEKDQNGHYVARERRLGTFRRSFDISGIEENEISAAYEDGILKLTLPKEGAKRTESRKISIQ